MTSSVGSVWTVFRSEIHFRDAIHSRGCCPTASTASEFSRCSSVQSLAGSGLLAMPVKSIAGKGTFLPRRRWRVLARLTSVMIQEDGGPSGLSRRTIAPSGRPSLTSRSMREMASVGPSRVLCNKSSCVARALTSRLRRSISCLISISSLSCGVTDLFAGDSLTFRKAGRTASLGALRTSLIALVICSRRASPQRGSFLSNTRTRSARRSKGISSIDSATRIAGLARAWASPSS